MHLHHILTLYTSMTVSYFAERHSWSRANWTLHNNPRRGKSFGFFFFFSNFRGARERIVSHSTAAGWGRTYTSTQSLPSQNSPEPQPSVLSELLARRGPAGRQDGGHLRTCYFTVRWSSETSSARLFDKLRAGMIGRLRAESSGFMCRQFGTLCGFAGVKRDEFCPRGFTEAADFLTETPDGAVSGPGAFRGREREKGADTMRNRFPSAAVPPEHVYRVAPRTHRP